MMTFEEIAQELGIPRTTAHTLYARAIRKLQKRNPHALALLRLMADDLAEVRRATRRAK
jgi:DNA-directed RNA polymerase specialized sigma24 family protein